MPDIKGRAAPLEPHRPIVLGESKRSGKVEDIGDLVDGVRPSVGGRPLDPTQKSPTECRLQRVVARRCRGVEDSVGPEGGVGPGRLICSHSEGRERNGEDRILGQPDRIDRERNRVRASIRRPKPGQPDSAAADIGHIEQDLPAQLPLHLQVELEVGGGTQILFGQREGQSTAGGAQADSPGVEEQSQHRRNGAFWDVEPIETAISNERTAGQRPSTPQLEGDEPWVEDREIAREPRLKEEVLGVGEGVDVDVVGDEGRKDVARLAHHAPEGDVVVDPSSASQDGLSGLGA